ncbi:MAG: hypothetical protein IJJ47_04345, partial [Methanosphaera sp.]|nr:hypothetical protein [Methanosphaera sp.]
MLKKIILIFMVVGLICTSYAMTIENGHIENMLTSSNEDTIIGSDNSNENINANNRGIDTVASSVSDFSNIEKEVLSLNKTIAILSKEPSIDKNPNIICGEKLSRLFSIGGVQPIGVTDFFLIFIGDDLQSKYNDNEISHFSEILNRKFSVRNSNGLTIYSANGSDVYVADHINVNYRNDEAVVRLWNNTDNTPPHQLRIDSSISANTNITIPDIETYINSNAEIQQSTYSDNGNDIQATLPENNVETV